MDKDGVLRFNGTTLSLSMSSNPCYTDFVAPHFAESLLFTQLIYYI